MDLTREADIRRQAEAPNFVTWASTLSANNNTTAYAYAA